MWSLMTGLQALAKHIWTIYVCRFMVGVFQAACNPPAYSIMADYFHPKFRTRANSIYSLGIYIGGALSSLTGLIISGVGWRWSFAILGIVGGAAGLLGFIFVQEPERNFFDPKKPADAPKVVKPPPLT
jgi:MFS family permease